MNFDNIITGISVIVSVVALYYATRKQGHDEKNSDADTITQMFTNFKEQEVRYKELKKAFDQYKTDMDAQFASVASENVKLRNWARKLARQLEQANITPVPYEE